MKLEVLNYPIMDYHIKSDYELNHFKDWSSKAVPDHYHPYYEIYYLISGNVTYVIEGKSYELKPGDIILVNNGELHKSITKPATVYERILIYISPEFIARHVTENTNLFTCFEQRNGHKSNLLRPNLDMKDNIKNIIFKLEKLQSDKNFGDEILRDIYIIELLVYLNKTYLNIKREDLETDIDYDENIESILNYINGNLDNDLSLETVSKMFHIDKYQLLRTFKKNIGYTIHQYIHLKRLLLAKDLLSEDLSITEICSKCGFIDYSNFIRSFKKAYGMPPLKYAKNNSYIYEYKS